MANLSDTDQEIEEIKIKPKSPKYAKAKFDNAAEELFHEKIVGLFPTYERYDQKEQLFASIDTTI